MYTHFVEVASTCHVIIPSPFLRCYSLPANQNAHVTGKAWDRGYCTNETHVMLVYVVSPITVPLNLERKKDYASIPTEERTLEAGCTHTWSKRQST